MWCAVLAGDNDVIIAGPILEQSEVLTDEDLIEIARSMSQDHLHPIAGRHTSANPCRRFWSIAAKAAYCSPSPEIPAHSSRG